MHYQHKIEGVKHIFFRKDLRESGMQTILLHPEILNSPACTLDIGFVWHSIRSLGSQIFYFLIIVSYRSCNFFSEIFILYVCKYLCNDPAGLGDLLAEDICMPDYKIFIFLF